MGQLMKAVQESAAFLVKAFRAAAGSVSDNSGLAVMSVVLAFALWILVTDAENPTQERVLPVDIQVQPVNLPPDVALARELQTVRLRVKVAEDVFGSLTEADFEATMDLEGLTVGEYDLPVEVRTLTSRGGLRIEDVLPERINVQLAQLTGKGVPVVVEVNGQPPSGYSMSEPKADDAEVFVTGPQELVDQVTQATATIEVEGKTEEIDQAVRLTARDGRGVLVKGVELDPAFTQVQIEVEQQKYTRSVSVSPQLTGSPADGYNVVGVSVNPPLVTIRGDEAFIQGTVSVPTKPVGLQGADADIVRTVSLDLPSGAEVTGGVPVVTVTVKIEPARGVMQFSVPLSATGLSDDLSIAGALPTVTVTLLGDLPALRELTPNDIGARVDVGGADAGRHRLTVLVTAPEGIAVQSVAPAEVEVLLEKR